MTAFLLSPFIALIPAVAVKLFDEGEGGRRCSITAQGVGAVAGALALASLARRYGRRRVLVVNLVVLPALLVALRRVARRCRWPPSPWRRWAPPTSACCRAWARSCSCGRRPPSGPGS